MKKFKVKYIDYIDGEIGSNDNSLDFDEFNFIFGDELLIPSKLIKCLKKDEIVEDYKVFIYDNGEIKVGCQFISPEKSLKLLPILIIPFITNKVDNVGDKKYPLSATALADCLTELSRV